MSLRAEAKIAIACVVVLAAAVLVYLLLFPASSPEVVLPAPPPPVVPAAAAPEGPVAFEMAEVDGVVEVRRGGRWVTVRSGDPLLANEAVRTGADGRAVLRAAGGAELTLRERVELEVTALTRTVTELTLRSGKVRAAASATAGRLAISSGSAQAVGAAGSRFTVYADPRGAVAVASDRGDVRVIAGGRTVALPERTQTIVEPGQPPREPAAIPDEVFLSVSWPSKSLRATRTTVAGVTAPGTIVSVNGQPTIVGPDGRFTTQVALREGTNRIELQAEALDGTTRNVSRKVTARTTGPPLDADPTRLYDDPPATDSPRGAKGEPPAPGRRADEPAPPGRKAP